MGSAKNRTPLAPPWAWVTRGCLEHDLLRRTGRVAISDQLSPVFYRTFVHHITVYSVVGREGWRTTVERCCGGIRRGSAYAASLVI